jgi:protein-tyrosine phosphatase
MSGHIAKKLNADLIKKYDLVLVMSNNQLKYIEQTWPFAKGKTFRLGHWQSKNVPDPYQHDQTVFDETCELIQSCIADWKKYI